MVFGLPTQERRKLQQLASRSDSDDSESNTENLFQLKVQVWMCLRRRRAAGGRRAAEGAVLFRLLSGGCEWKLGTESKWKLEAVT